MLDMDELIPNTNNIKEIECAKNMRIFLNFHFQSLSKLIVFRAFNDRLYIVSIYTRIIDVIYSILTYLTFIQQFNTKFFIHAIKIKPFQLENTDYICNLINMMNYNLMKSAKNKLNFNLNLKGLIILGKDLNLPEDIVGLIGNFLYPTFSTNYYHYLNYIVNGNLTVESAIKILKNDIY
tara:strand:- start:213 stop:749 length:537 start_codon:yes stop_codon:yes gene_type:complete